VERQADQLLVLILIDDGRVDDLLGPVRVSKRAARVGDGDGDGGRVQSDNLAGAIGRNVSQRADEEQSDHGQRQGGEEEGIGRRGVSAARCRQRMLRRGFHTAGQQPDT
jgi:hypothetical protein